MWNEPHDTLVIFLFLGDFENWLEGRFVFSRVLLFVLLHFLFCAEDAVYIGTHGLEFFVIILTYYQVTADMTAEETFEREMRPLRSIHDNYEKIVLTLDRFSLGNYDGIKVVNVIDWLLG